MARKLTFGTKTSGVGDAKLVIIVTVSAFAIFGGMSVIEKIKEKETVKCKETKCNTAKLKGKTIAVCQETLQRCKRK